MKDKKELSRLIQKEIGELEIRLGTLKWLKDKVEKEHDRYEIAVRSKGKDPSQC